jgi:D-glycero-alpha-D-manno-heptose-7-phosphate kinase
VDLGVPTGNQDYLAALHGGLAAYHHGFDGTIREKIRIPEGLQDRLVLAYTGQPRKSGFSNWDMFKRTVERDRVTDRWMRAIARVARDLRAALRDGDLDAAGRLLGEEGRLRYRLAPTVATSKLLAVDAAARGAGALGAKVCGAGGGGCLLAIAPEGGKEDVARAMVAAGARVLDARLARRGLRVSEPRSGS